MVLNQPRLPGSKPMVEPAVIGIHARIGGGAVVCGAVTVGDRAIVAAGEVVEDDVPADAVWMGGRMAGSSK